jgi:hypothetical protein
MKAESDQFPKEHQISNFTQIYHVRVVLLNEDVRASRCVDRWRDGHNTALVNFRSCFAIARIKVRLPVNIFQDNYTLVSYLKLSLSSLHCFAMAVTKSCEINFPVILHAKQSSECTTQQFAQKNRSINTHIKWMHIKIIYVASVRAL